MSNNNCKCWRCVGALQDRRWTVRGAIIALDEAFTEEMPSESKDELDSIMARLHGRERELINLIGEMEPEAGT